MPDDELSEGAAWDRELTTLKGVMRARRPEADARAVDQQATGILLLSTLPPVLLVDAVGMLRHDLERRGLTLYARLSVVVAGDIDYVTDPDTDPPKTSGVVGVILTGTHDEVRKAGSGLYQTLTVEIPGAAL